MNWSAIGQWQKAVQVMSDQEAAVGGQAL